MWEAKRTMVGQENVRNGAVGTQARTIYHASQPDLGISQQEESEGEREP